MSPHRSPLALLARICLIAVLLLIAVPTNQAHSKAQAAAFSTSWLAFTTEYPKKPSLVIDPNNGMHAVFTTQFANDDGKYASYYAYCPSGCSNDANWSYINLGEIGLGGSVQALALTSQGNPRVLWNFYNYVGRAVYYYSECNGNCGVPSNWRTAPILDAYWYTDSNQNFAIDPQGTAHFIYADSSNAPHNGFFYTSCASNCTNSSSWSEVKIGDGYMDTVDLKFGPNGQPKVAYRDGSNLFYGECNTACDNIDHWIGTTVVTNTSSDTSFALEITKTGLPRLIFYNNGLLSYAWCNTNCVTSSNWTVTSPGLPTDYGINVDLELDSQDHPVISYQVNETAGIDHDGFYYAACTAGCETTNPSWAHQLVENLDQLNAAAPLPNPANCQFNAWIDVGLESALALDANGVPHFAYGAENYANCSGKVSSYAKGIRLATAGNGEPVLDKHIYLPTVIR